MKKSIIYIMGIAIWAIALIVMGLLSSCNDSSDGAFVQSGTMEQPQTTYRIETIEGCQYIIWPQSAVHKANCRNHE